MAEKWYEKYFNEHSFLSKIDDNILQLFDKTNKLDNIINEIEQDYLNQINFIKKIDITKLNYKEKNSLELLQEEQKIIKLLNKYSLQNNNYEYDFFIKSFELILYISKILQKRLNQPLIYHNFDNNISRCSYKFCNYKDSCNYNYNSKSICYQDHFVHNMVSADIDILIKYINKNNKNNIIKYNKEISKSINTLHFVINHMENELKTKCMYEDKNNWEKQHISRKKVNKIPKKNFNKYKKKY